MKDFAMIVINIIGNSINFFRSFDNFITPRLMGGHFIFMFSALMFFRIARQMFGKFFKR